MPVEYRERLKRMMKEMKGWTMDELDSIRLDVIKNGFVITVSFKDMKRNDEQYVQLNFEQALNFIDAWTQRED